jgi:hypothetical protein
MPEGRVEFDNDIPLLDGVEMISPPLDLVDFPHVAFTIRKIGGPGTIDEWCIDGSPDKHEDYKELANLKSPAQAQNELVFASGVVTNITNVGDYENYIVNALGMQQIRARALSIGDVTVKVAGIATPYL